jgi:hypothetical protein
VLAGLDPITISLGEFLLNPLKNVLGGLIPKVASITRLGMVPTDPEMPTVDILARVVTLNCNSLL